MNVQRQIKAPSISNEEQDRRRRAIDFARGSIRYEGLIPSAEAEQINQDFICGKLSMDEALKAVEALG